MRFRRKKAVGKADLAHVHVEDRDGHALDLKGSLGTHELKVGELEIDATSRQFEVMRNDLGQVEVDSDLRLRGQLE